MEPHKKHTIQASPVLFRSNGKFKVKKKHVHKFNGGDILFDTSGDGNEDIVYKHYWCVGGPVFRHKGESFTLDSVGIRGAVTRVTNCREPTNVGLERRLMINQYCMYNDLVYSARVKAWQEWFRTKYCLLRPDKDSAEWREEWYVAPHPKRQIRIGVRNDFHADGRDGDHYRMRYISYVGKPGEILEPGKALRAVGDMTAPGSSKGGYFMSTVKNVFAVPYEHAHGTSIFVEKPERSALREVFRNVWQIAHGFVHYYFSDDGIFGAVCTDGTLVVNLDARKADASAGQPIADCLQAICTDGNEHDVNVIGAMDQLRLPAKVRNPADSKDSVTMYPNGTSILWSGSTYTTGMNNTYQNLKMIRFNQMWAPGKYTMKETMRILEDSALYIGYILKVDVCRCFEDLQFLKYSPCFLDDGDIEVWLNLGVWLRGFGMCFGELPGSSKIGQIERWARYNSDVVRSRVHAGNHVLHDAFLSHRRDVDYGTHKETYMEALIVGDAPGRVHVSALARRYGVPDAWISELCELIGRAGYGNMIMHPVIHEIMTKDYGYP
jgi:hypothetical protein